MLRDKLKTDLGRLVYDYSEITKYSLPDHVRENIADGFFKRNNIDSYRFENIAPGVDAYVANGEASLQLFSDWRYSFDDFGYTPPILELTTDVLSE